MAEDVLKRGMDALAGEATVSVFTALIRRGLVKKKKNFLLRSKYFHFKVVPFPKGTDLYSIQWEVTKVVSS